MILCDTVHIGAGPGSAWLFKWDLPLNGRKIMLKSVIALDHLITRFMESLRHSNNHCICSMNSASLYDLRRSYQEAEFTQTGVEKTWTKSWKVCVKQPLRIAIPRMEHAINRDVAPLVLVFSVAITLWSSQSRSGMPILSSHKPFT